MADCGLSSLIGAMFKSYLLYVAKLLQYSIFLSYTLLQFNPLLHMYMHSSNRNHTHKNDTIEPSLCTLSPSVRYTLEANRLPLATPPRPPSSAQPRPPFLVRNVISNANLSPPLSRPSTANINAHATIRNTATTRPPASLQGALSSFASLSLR